MTADSKQTDALSTITEPRGPSGNGRSPCIVHLTASPCFGGPERQMLELGKELGSSCRSVYVTFREEERCRDFVRQARMAGFQAVALKRDMPRLLAAYRELTSLLRSLNAGILVCHGYKAGILGRLAARFLHIPVVAVSRGWTGESLPVRLFEWLDCVNLRWMDRVICVSGGQAAKVRKAGVAEDKIAVIHNAIRTERFQRPYGSEYRLKLEARFPVPPAHIVGAAGRLSPEKGFDVLIEGCRRLVRTDTMDLGVILFGDGFLRQRLEEQVHSAGLADRFVLAGFTDELDRYMPHFDLFVQSSHTEGLPNVLLEAAAAGVPVVATNVGGTGEVVADGGTGLLVPPADSDELAHGIRRLLHDDSLRGAMRASAPLYVTEHFTFAQQARRYGELFSALGCHPSEISSVDDVGEVTEVFS